MVDPRLRNASLAASPFLLLRRNRWDKTTRIAMKNLKRFNRLIRRVNLATRSYRIYVSGGRAERRS